MKKSAIAVLVLVILAGIGQADRATTTATVGPNPCTMAANPVTNNVCVANSNDMLPGNDRSNGTSAVAPSDTGWTRKPDLPLGAKSKNIKDGGALAYAPPAPSLGSDTGYIYAFKGNNRYEFYRYNTVTDAWIPLDSIPAGGRLGRTKAVKKGGALTVGTDGKVYGTKGNGTLEFWCYDPAASPGSRWTQMADVPAGTKALKEGVGLAAVNISGADYVYLLKGSGTYEFYRYHNH